MNKPYPMNVAQLASKNSKHNGAHVGCVIASKSLHVLSIGWNGNAPGADDDAINALERDDRLPFSIHAEENSLLNAAMFGTKVDGCDAYVTGFPCCGCISKLFKAGIDKIYYILDEDFELRWKNQHLHVFGVREHDIIAMSVKETQHPDNEPRGIYERLRNILSLHFNHDFGKINSESAFFIDSIDVIEITMVVEEEFGIDIEDKEVEELVTVVDACKLIEEKLK